MSDDVTVTDGAAARAGTLLAKAGLRGGGLRVRVQSAGCEGFVAILDLAPAPYADEIEIAANGVRLFADISSMLELPGATLDHRATDHGAEFVWSHPAATGVCGCAEPDHEHVFAGDTAQPAT
ncbi:MAG: iron-sulfur cluster assembly accessory protein [Mycobacteriales bacterium]